MSIPMQPTQRQREISSANNNKARDAIAPYHTLVIDGESVQLDAK